MEFKMPLSEGYSIRGYVEDDLARLQEITTQAFGPVSIDKNMESLFGSFGSGNWSTRKASAIADDCHIHPAGVFVVEDATHIVGYVTTRLNQVTKIGWILNLAVVSEHRSKGLGRALLEHAIAYFRAEYMQIAKIETLEQNPIGQSLYPSLGFVEVARQVHYGMRLCVCRSITLGLRHTRFDTKRVGGFRTSRNTRTTAARNLTKKTFILSFKHRILRH